MKYTGTNLVEIRDLIARCVDHITLFQPEKQFIKKMDLKAKGSVMILSEKQNDWLLLIINRAVTFDCLHGHK